MDHHHSRFTSRHLLVAVHLSHYMCPFSVRGNSLAGVREDTRTDSRSGCHSTTSWFRAESAGFTSLLADDLPPKFFLYVHFCIGVRLWTLGLSLDKVYNANLHIRWWKKLPSWVCGKAAPAHTQKKYSASATHQWISASKSTIIFSFSAHDLQANKNIAPAWGCMSYSGWVMTWI